jgi:biotin carboxyl carrier protein
LVALAFLSDRYLVSRADTAVMTGAPIVLRAPVEGTLSGPALRPGLMLPAGGDVGSIRNALLDRARLSDLRAALAQAESEATLLGAREAAAMAALADADAAAAAFREIRGAQMDARIAEAQASRVSAAARLRVAEVQLSRLARLGQTGAASAASVDQAQRDRDVAAADLAAADARIVALQAERSGVARGIQVGADAGDRTVSQQAADRLRREIAEISASRAAAAARVETLSAQVREEETRMAQVGAHDLSVPVRARILAVHAVSGEHVRPGQEIATLIDCARPVAQAVVSRGVFERLSLGLPAVFREADTGRRWQGQVVQLLSPLQPDPSRPAADADRFRAVVALEGTEAREACPAGIPGALTFGR